MLANSNDDVVITVTTNKILKIIKTDKTTENETALGLKYKLDMLNDEIRNIAYVIHWAKSNIINSFIKMN